MLCCFGLGVQEVVDPNEPEIRKVLRQRRIQEKHQRMQQQVPPALMLCVSAGLHLPLKHLGTRLPAVCSVFELCRVPLLAVALASPDAARAYCGAPAQSLMPGMRCIAR